MKTIRLSDIGHLLLATLLLLLPIWKAAHAYIILAWGVLVLINYFAIDKKTSISGDFNFLKNLLDIRTLMVLYWLFFALSLFWVADIDRGKFSLEVKFSFLIVPILFTLIYISKLWRLRFMWFFILGNAIAGVINLTRSTLTYLETGKTTSFIMKYFSDLIHPSYWGMYLLLACMFCIHIILKKAYNKKWKRSILWILFSFFIVCILLVQSKNVVIFSILIPLIFIFRYIVKEKQWKRGLAALMTLLFIMFGAFTFVPNLSGRFMKMYDAVMDDSQTKLESTVYRLMAWNASFHLIENKPLQGYGVGQAKGLIKERINAINADQFKGRPLDPHSQILSSWIEGGLIGLIILLMMFISLILYGYRNKNLLIILFSCLVFFSCLTESMFETQSGVLFFVFFALILSGPLPDNGSYEV